MTTSTYWTVPTDKTISTGMSVEQWNALSREERERVHQQRVLPALGGNRNFASNYNATVGPDGQVVFTFSGYANLKPELDPNAAPAGQFRPPPGVTLGQPPAGGMPPGSTGRGGGVGRAIGPPMDDPAEGDDEMPNQTKPLAVGAVFQGVRGGQVHSTTITRIHRGPNGEVTGADVTYTDANGQQVPGNVNVDGLRFAGFDLGGGIEGASPAAGGDPSLAWTGRVSPAGPGITAEPERPSWLAHERQGSGRATVPPTGAGTVATPRPSSGTPQPGRTFGGPQREVERGTGSLSTNPIPGIEVERGTGNASIPSLGQTGSTDLGEQQGLADILRSIVLGGGVTPGFQPLEEAALGRQLMPFLVNTLTASSPDPVASASPGAFRQYLSSAMSGGGGLNLGDTLGQAGQFLEQSAGTDLGTGAQLALRDILQGPAGSVGSELFAPIIAEVGQGLGRNFGIDLGKYVAEAMANNLAQNPSQYTTAEGYIQALGQQGILEWLNRRF